jgi:hypothetical protein
MTSILKADNIQDADGNNIINESSNTITIGASGDTISIPSGATIANSGTATGFGGITMADQWRITSNFSNSSGSADITANWERVDTYGYGVIGTGLTESSGIFSFPSTGIYKITAQHASSSGAALAYAGLAIKTTTDNSSYNTATEMYSNTDSSGQNHGGMVTFIFDVTNTSTHKYKLTIQNSGANNYEGSTNTTMTGTSVIRLGDT